ncbi:ArnT family glycosyltransferase [Bacteroides cellulosilyticus]|uniref:ArnT family glycosyltransferase n=1 Tax=Bacteroides cellulosilyticus TaxID=246787 RepID=UPI0022DED2D6|nr:glycosyltransferase family 39 protein [Bacteroides cellulosilyticus]
MELIEEKKKKQYFIPVIILLIGMFFTVVNIGERKLWVDECVSAYLAKNIVEYGYPSVYDGTYYKSVANGNDSNNDGVEVWYSWFTMYLQALFIALFGTSEFAIRLPTSILGWLSMLYLFLSLRKMTTSSFIQNITLIAYVCCVPIIIYIRSAHYYSGSLCFTTMSLFYFLRILESSEKKIDSIFFSLSLILLFHSNYFLFIIPATSYLLYAFIKCRQKKVWIKLLITYGIAFLFTAPWFLYITLTSKGYKAGVILGLTGVEDMFQKLSIYICKFQAYFTPICVLIIILFALKFISKCLKVTSNEKRNSYMLILPLTFVFVCLFVSVILEPFPQTRRILTVIPMIIFLSSCIIYEIILISKIIGYTIIPIVLFTNWFNVMPWKIISHFDIPVCNSLFIQSPITLQTLLPDNAYSYAINECKYEIPLYNFYNEISKKFVCRSDAIIEYLQEYSKPGETVICATIEAPKIYYYTGLKIVKQLDIDGGVWGPLGPYYFHDYPNSRRKRNFDYIQDHEIDWILSQDLVAFTFDDKDYFKKNRAYYEKIEIDAPNTFIDNTAEMDCHYFVSREKCKNINIYKRKNQQ